MRALLLLSVFAIPLAHAGVVHRSGDWELDDTSTRSNPNGTCIARTIGGDDRVDMALELRLAKNKPGALLEMYLTQEYGRVKAWDIVLRDDSVLATGHAGKVGRQETFWAVPQKIAAVIAQLQDRRDIKLRTADGSRDPRYTLSADGFKSVLAKLEERCNNKLAAHDAGFEAAFTANNPVAKSGGFTAETTAQVRELFLAAHGVHLSKGANAKEMVALRTRFATELAEAAKLEDTIKRVDGTDIPATIAAQGANDTRETNAQAELQRLSVAIPAHSAAVTSAQGVVDRAETAIAPHRAEYSQRSSAASSARRVVINSESRIAQLDSERASALSSIRSLESERSMAQDSANRASRELFSAEQEERRAESEFRNFDPNRELRWRLDRSSEYQRAEREFQTSVAEQRNAENQVADARKVQTAAEAKLTGCRATTGADCTGAEAAVNDARNEVARLQGIERNLENRVAQLRSILNNERQRAEREVEAIRTKLGHDMSRAQQRVSELRSAQNRAETRVREISNFEIPRLNDQITSIDRERPLVVSELNRARPIAQQLEAELAAFDRRVGYTPKYEALVSAQRALNARTSELNQALASQRSANQTVASTQAERIRLANLLESQRQALAAARARLVVVRQSLEPFEAERSRLETVAGQLDGQFKDLASQFASRLPQ
jgi:chromosome segregation ATPase